MRFAGLRWRILGREGKRVEGRKADSGSGKTVSGNGSGEP